MELVFGCGFPVLSCGTVPSLLVLQVSNNISPSLSVSALMIFRIPVFDNG